MPRSDDPLSIRRCVCGDTTFEELVREGVRTMEEAENRGCGVNCGLCRPYLERMVATGETAFAPD